MFRLTRIHVKAILFVTVAGYAIPSLARTGAGMDQTDYAQWTTHCVGRFLIDLPADAEHVGGSYDYAFATVERKPMGRDAFLQEVNGIEQRLKDSKHDSGTSLLLKTVAPNKNIKVLGYWESKDQRVGVDISGYGWVNGQRYLLHKGASPSKVDEAVARMATIMSKLRGRESDPPTVPGFCIEQALFADADSSSNESLNIRFRLKSPPDIVLDIATNLNAGAPPEGLLSRKPSVLSALGLLGATVGGVSNIREGDRTIRGYPGQEWLLKAPNDQGKKSHLFTWEAPGLQGDELHPQIRIDLQSGNNDGGMDPKPISLTDQQMLELWERILGSLRLRPTDKGEGTPAGKAPPQANAGDAIPLGELARSGTKCPQSGYWQCPDRDVHGSTRLFHQGETMPAAIFKRELSFIERMTGTNAEVSTNTAWRLVKYTEVSQTPAPSTFLNDQASPSSES
jgi:hypothetical protein